MRSGDTLQVTMNLISGKDDGVLWSKKVDLPWSDILTIQSQFAEIPVREIAAKLAPPGNRFAITTSNGDAYDSLLKGRFSLTQYLNHGQPEFLQAADARVQRALELDPGYTDAMAEMADVRLTQLYPPRGNREVLLADAKKWLDRAVSKDPNHLRANSLMGSVYRERGEYLKSLAYARKGVEKAPGDGQIHHQLELCYSALGFFESALVENEKALKTDLPQVAPLYGKVWYLVTLGKFKETETAIREEILPFDRKGAMFPAAEALLQLNKGNYQKSREIYETIQEEGVAFRESFEIGAALSRAAAGETGVGRAALKKYASAGIRERDDILLLAAVVGDADTMARLTRESPSHNSYGWLVRYPTFMKNVAGQQPFRKLVFDLYQRWEANLAAEGPSLPVRPPALPKPEEFLASLR